MIKEIDKLQHLPKDISGYQDFNNYYYSETGYSDEQILTDFLEKQKNTLKDILVVELKNDIFLTREEQNTLPDAISRFLSFAENRPLIFYIMHHIFAGKDFYKTIVGGFGGTTLRTNDYLMKIFLENTKIKSITRKNTVSLKKIWEESVIKTHKSY